MWVFFGFLAFALGASVGSFLNVVADRLPAGRSIVRPGSFCESCERSLTSLDLVPVFSYLWLRGRCRYCGSVVPVRLMFVEIATGLVFTAVYLRFGLWPDFIVLSAGGALLVVVALIDLERGLILNKIVYPAALVLIIVAPFWPEMGLERPFLSSDSMLASLINSLLSGVGYFLLFLGIILLYPQGMGGGDVKLAGVIGLLVGFPSVLVALWVATVGGGLVAIPLLVSGKRSRKDAIPFGPFLSLGALVGLLAGSDIITAYDDLAVRLFGP